MIASVAFRNFKALRAASLALGPFNLVIGPNGSGKTSLITALLRLRTLAKLPLSRAEDPQRLHNGPQIDFTFSPPYETITARLGCVSELVCDLLQVSPPDAAGWPALRADIAGIRSYRLDAEALAEPSRRPKTRGLSANGGNLAGLLALYRDRQPEAFAALTGEVVRIMPEFSGVELVEREGGAVELALRLDDGGLVVAADLSQGTLYLIAILALAFDPDPPSILCIEEIDRGIHPRLLRELRDALYHLSHPQSFDLKRPVAQVIATTHSPYLLDLYRDHPEEIVLAHKQGVTARFERLADRTDLAELIREGPLGDLWYSGVLGSVPEER